MNKPSLKTTYFRGLFRDQAGNQDYDMVRLLKKQDRVSVRPEYLISGPHEGTPFVNVVHDMTGCAELFGQEEILSRQFMYRREIQSFAHDLFQETVRYFLTMWNDTPKIVFHSGGYDSRIMSLALREVRKTIGDKAFGKVHFRCHQPENDLFIAIMQMQGWEEEYYSVWEGPDEDYYGVGREGITMNGYMPHIHSMNFWSDIIPANEEKNWIVVSGLGGEVFKYLSNYPKEHAVHCPNRALSLLIEHNPERSEWEGMWMRDFKDVWIPFWGYDYLRLSTSCPPEWCVFDLKKGTDNIRMAVVDCIMPELNDIDHGKHKYTWAFSEKRKWDMIERYRNSAFYLRYQRDIQPFTELAGHDSRLWSVATVYEAAL